MFPRVFSGGDAVVLTAVMILWVNFVTDGPPAIALAADERMPNVMDRPPRDPDAKIIDRKMLSMIAVTGPLAAVVFLPLFFTHVQEFVLAQSMLFTTLATFEVVPLSIGHWSEIAVVIAAFTALIAGYQWVLQQAFGKRSGPSESERDGDAPTAHRHSPPVKAE